MRELSENLVGRVYKESLFLNLLFSLHPFQTFDRTLGKTQPCREVRRRVGILLWSFVPPTHFEESAY